MRQTFDIPRQALATLRTRVARATRRAAASGLPVPSFTETGSWTREIQVYDPLHRMRGAESDHRTVRVPMATVEAEGFSPGIGEWNLTGYRYAARRGQPAYSAGDVPEHMAARPLCCDHCRASRRRTATFVLAHRDTGQVNEVGSNCLEAFTGHGAGYAEGLCDMGRVLAEARALHEAHPLLSVKDAEEEARTVLAFAWRRTGDDGFVSSADARLTGTDPTWMDVMDDIALYRRPGTREEDLNVTMGDFMAADEIAKAFEGHPRGTFHGEVAHCLERGLAGTREVAMLTAAAALHRRDLARRAEDEIRARLAAGSAHQGEEGERLDFVGKVRKVAEFQGRWGVRRFVTVSDPQGNFYLWKTGSGEGLEPGLAYEMRGTVSGHGSFAKGPWQGAAMTEISRVAVGRCLGAFEDVETPGDDDIGEALDAALSMR